MTGGDKLIALTCGIRRKNIKLGRALGGTPDREKVPHGRPGMGLLACQGLDALGDRKVARIRGFRLNSSPEGGVV